MNKMIEEAIVKLQTASVSLVGAPAARIALEAAIQASIDEAVRAEHEEPEEPEEPTLVILFCPMCHKQHIDEGEWSTRPHKTHQCVDDACGKGCGNEWRASLVPTVGVTYAELANGRAANYFDGECRCACGGCKANPLPASALSEIAIEEIEAWADADDDVLDKTGRWWVACRHRRILLAEVKRLRAEVHYLEMRIQFTGGFNV